MRPLLLACLLLLLLPAAAGAGGWAITRVLNAPDDLVAGQTWRAQFEVLQHGRTPLRGVSPAIVVGDRRFPATAVPGRDGVYEAAAVFPRAGRIEYTIDDGFTNAMPHEFALRVRESAAPADDPAPISDAPQAGRGGASAAVTEPPTGGEVPWTAVFALTGIALLLALTLPALRARPAPRPGPGSPLRGSRGSAPHGS